MQLTLDKKKNITVSSFIFRVLFKCILHVLRLKREQNDYSHA